MKKKIQKNNNTDYSLAHVLYQKLGTDWYAFTEKDGDCFMTKVDPATVQIPEYAFESNEPRAAKRRAA
jgi:hypothetical protein